MRSIKRAGYPGGAHISTQPELSTVKTQRVLLRMNTYQVVLGCVVIICYLQQHGWAAPSQIENARSSIQQTQVDDQLREEILRDALNHMHVLLNQSDIQKRQASETTPSPLDVFRQWMRNYLYPLFYCPTVILRRDMRVHYLDVSNTTHVCTSSYVPVHFRL